MAFVAGAGGLDDFDTRLLVPTGGAVVLAASLIFFVTLGDRRRSASRRVIRAATYVDPTVAGFATLMHSRLALRHHAHFQELDERFAPLEQAVALEQRLFFERLEMLGDRVDQIGVRDVLRDEVVVALLELPREQLFEPMPRIAARRRDTGCQLP